MLQRSQTRYLVALGILLVVCLCLLSNRHVDFGFVNKQNVYSKRNLNTTNIINPAQQNEIGMPLLEQLVDPSGQPIRCFFINLDRSHERREQFTNRAAKHGLQCTRIKGIDGQVADELRILVRNDFPALMPSQKGCAASHLLAINTVHEAGLKYALIFEDDTSFDLVDKWPKNVITKLLADLPSYIGVIQLYWSQVHNMYANSVAPEYLAKNTYCPMASAYIVTQKGMCDILSVTKVDHNSFQLVRNRPEVDRGNADVYVLGLTPRCTCSLPLFCVDIELASTIQPNIPLRLQDHGCYADVKRVKEIYSKHRVMYKSHLEDFMYRLGDTVAGVYTGISEADAVHARAYHMNKYPESLAAKYCLRTEINNDIDTLTVVVKEFIKEHKCTVPGDNSVVVHLRLGDVLEKSTFTVDEHTRDYLDFTNGVNYIKPFSYFHEALNTTSPTQSVILLFGTPLGNIVTGNETVTKSMEYVLKLQSFIETMNFTCSIHKSASPDEDFVFGVSATQLITTGGNFSRLMLSVHQKLVVRTVKHHHAEPL